MAIFSLPSCAPVFFFFFLISVSLKRLAAVKSIPSRSLAGQLGALLGVVVPDSLPTISLFIGAVGLRAGLHFGFGMVSGKLLTSALERNGTEFLKALAAHLVLDVSAGLVDEGSNFLQNKLAVQWTKSITHKLMGCFFEDSFFYNAKIDGRISDPDARVLEAQELAQRLSGVFASSVPPALDVLVFGGSLYKAVGWNGLRPLAVYAGVAGVILALAAPKNTSLEEARLESAYRALQVRVKASAESIAFLNGGAQEAASADNALAQLIRHQLRANTTTAVFKTVLYSVYQDVDSYSSIVTLPKVVNQLLQLQQPAKDGTSRAASNAFLGAAAERCEDT